MRAAHHAPGAPLDLRPAGGFPRGVLFLRSRPDRVSRRRVGIAARRDGVAVRTCARAADHRGARLMAGNHPVFAPLYNGLAWAGEKTTLGRWRTEALAPAFGRLLIIGLGPGYDLAHVPPAVTEIVAVEPAVAMRRIARRKAGSRPLSLVAGVGEQLPLPDASVDSVLCALVLCSVD